MIGARPAPCYASNNPELRLQRSPDVRKSPASKLEVPAAGYSGTPLAKKLGIGLDSRLLALSAPDDYRSLLAPLPKGVRFETRAGTQIDVAHVFVTRRSDLERQLTALRRALRPSAALWVSWPKKAAKVDTDITEDTIRDVALPLGFVDIKVCAVSAIWSGLKLVVRKELR